MPYINTLTSIYPVSERDIRNAYPNTSFTSPFQAPSEYKVVFPTPQPTFDPITQVVREVAPTLSIKGEYEQAWEVVPRFEEYEDEQGVIHTVAEQIAAAQAEAQKVLLETYDQALTNHLDAVAQARRYDNRITCALRAGYAGPYHDECAAFAVWMDTCNATAYQWMQEIAAGTRPMFNSPDEMIDALPVMVWPV